MALLTKEQILKAEDLPREVVDVNAEWGGEVTVRTLSAHERDLWELRQAGKSEKPDEFNVRASLCALCMVDAEGKQMFGLVEVAALGKKSGAALDKVFEVACRLNRIGAEKVEEAKKNSKPPPVEFLS